MSNRILWCLDIIEVIGHAAVAHFGVVFIADFMQAVGRWEMFREHSEELECDVSFYVLAVWRIKPHNVSFPFFLTGAWDVNTVYCSPPAYLLLRIAASYSKMALTNSSWLNES